MKNQNLKSFLVVAGLAVVIVGIGNWMNSQTSSDQEAAIGRKAKTTVSATPGASTDNALYNQLVQNYRNARIQFNASCQASPVTASYRNGATIMLDNRSNQAHSVSIGGTIYALPAYGHQIITVSSPTIPGTLSVNCDRLVNVAIVKLSI